MKDFDLKGVLSADNLQDFQTGMQVYGTHYFEFVYGGGEKFRFFECDSFMKRIEPTRKYNRLLINRIVIAMFNDWYDVDFSFDMLNSESRKSLRAKVRILSGTHRLEVVWSDLGGFGG